MLAIVSWISLGAALGLAGSTFVPEVSPAERVVAVLAGAAGGFVGGGLVALLVERGSAKLNIATLAAAAVAAVLVLAATRRAHYAQPRPQ